MPLRLLQDHLGDFKKRIRPARHLDLFGERLNAAVIRDKSAVDFRQRCRWWSFATKLVALLAPSGAAPLGLSSFAEASTTSFGRTRAVRRTVSSRAATWKLIAPPRRTITANFALVVAALGVTYVLGVLVLRLSRPGGQEMQIQIKFSFGRRAHGNRSGSPTGGREKRAT